MKRLRYLWMALLLLTGSGFAAWGLGARDIFVVSKPHVAVEEKPPAADPKILEELVAVYAQLGGKDWAMEGVVAMTDKAAPDAGMAPTEFTYRQQGNKLYYRLGKTEIVNLEDCYIVVQHDSKKILLSPPKEVGQPPYLPLEALVKMTEVEEYAVTKKLNGNIATISLGRENHISCKEYAVSYDTATLQIRKIRTRLTNLDFPMDADKEKVMEVDITGWPVSGNREYLSKSHYIRGEGNVPAPAFQDYELIRL